MIPVCEPTLKGNVKKYVDECIETNWISSQGRFIDEFERGFAKFCGVKEAISCCNGTTALHLMLTAAGVGGGDEVIVPDFTMIASANAVFYTGAKPVFVDADKETYCIDINKIEEKITKNTRAIMPVHIYGHPCDIGQIRDIAEARNILVLEDSAEAHGAEYKESRCGSLGNAAAFSFYGNKILTTGEGGMVVTNDADIAERARNLRNHFFGKGADKYLHKEIGFNYRMTNIQAAIGLSQLEIADELINARRKNAQVYNSLLNEINGLMLPPEKEWAKNVYWMYGIVLNECLKITKEDFMKKLLEKGIDSRSFFAPMHKQPCFANKNMLNLPDCSGSYPVSTFLSKRGLYLPSSSSLNEEQITVVCRAIAEILNYVNF
ncbi:DegT/DnrJ/EryC1/StrS family aminotransferase [Candidatus Woesearchaeota archaeon]|nr:DegT/DnrJ/EryC1/StrS family aminotransferase [Candidatus Woesearchaeota archaeon]